MEWLKGYKLKLASTVYIPPEPTTKFSNAERSLIWQNIQELLAQRVIVPCHPVKGQFLSHFFLVDKPNGQKRFVLNLKKLNSFIIKEHFKMDDWRTAAKLVQNNCYMTTIDLKEAYFSIPIHSSYRKLLRFKFNNNIYEFTCMPFGLSSAPFVYTKLMKPVVSFIHRLNICCMVYLDDFLVLSKSKAQCIQNTNMILKLLESLGFLVNYEKSCLSPKQKCKFLGFIFDSSTMTIELPDEKKIKILSTINKFRLLKTCKIKFLAHLIGLLISSLPTVKYGLCYIKKLEREKIDALKKTNQNYNKSMSINHSSINTDLEWWLQKTPIASQYIKEDYFHLEIYTDSSSLGWGAYCQGEETHGWWSKTEKLQHINYLELMAAFYGLKCFANETSSINILIRVDNVTALSYINRMGSIKHTHLNDLARNIWNWCEDKNIWIQASYVCSNENLADKASRTISTETEWELNEYAFSKIKNKFGKPAVDLFASNINKKCDTYVSLNRDPDASAIDAFTISWKDIEFYAFPPFALVLRVLKKIVTDQACGILVVPNWPCQAWYTLFNNLLITEPLILGPNANLLCSPFSQSFPMKITLVVGKLSGKRSY